MGKYLLLGYIFNKNSYKNFDVFSHYEHKSFVSGIILFETGTSLTLGLKYNHKVYSNNISGSSVANTNSQLGISSSISQSINNSADINGYVAFRKNLKDGTRYFNTGDWIIYEEEIFNDIYSNEGYDLGISFTKYLSAVILTKLEFTYSRKDFPYIPVPDAEGYDTDIMRKDNQFAGGFAIEFYLKNLINGISLELNWNYIHNKSNDQFYNYNNNLLSAGLNWGL